MKKKNKFLTKILSLLMLFVMGFGAMSFTKANTVYASVAEEHDHSSWKNWGDKDSEKISLPGESGDYVLTSDITLSETWTVLGGTTNLCLNGHVINANGENFRVITIGEATILNLYDCGDTSHNGYVDSNGLWHLGEGEGTAKTLTGGIITGGYFADNSSSGGGVHVGNGEFNMYGGTIAGNKAGANGGGVFVGTGGKFTMSAGGIIFNKASTGGGVAIQSGTFEINGGVVANNSATNGGGVFIFNGTCTMKGGRISNNTATTKAGGFYDNGTLIVGGSAVITDNTETVNEIPSNVYLYGKTITLGTDENAPTTMSIGVTTKTAPGEDTPIKITTNGTKDNLSNFFSDNNNYKVCFNNNGTEDNETDDYLELRTAYAITNNTKEADKATNNGYIEVIETAIKDEEVSVTVYPNQGYKLSSLVFNYETQDHDITLTKSFTMPKGAVSVTATFEEKAEQVVTIVLDEKFIYPITPYITEKQTYSTSNYYEKLGDGVVTVEYKAKAADDSEYTTEVPTEYGEYTIRVSVAEGSEYQAGFATKDFIYSPQIITQVGFGNLQQPVAGEVVPEKTGGMLVNTKYSETLTWDPEISTVNEDGKKIFVCSTTYTAIVTLTIKVSFADNYVFAEEPTLKGAGSGWVLSEDSTDKTLIYTKEFEPTGTHSVNKINGTNATCTEDGFEDAYQCETCGLYYEDLACSELIGDGTAYNSWKLNGGKISASGHETTKVNGQSPTCTEDGYKDAYFCEKCNKYFEDSAYKTLIGDSTAYESWKLSDGLVEATGHTYGKPTSSWNGNQVTLTVKCSCGNEQTQTFTGTYTKVTDATCTAKETGKYVVTIAEVIFAGTYESSVFETGNPLGHHTTLVNGQSTTCAEDGYEDAYYCADCGMYFENADGTDLIGNETAYNTWKLNGGKISKTGHHTTLVNGQSATCTEDGYEDAYYCADCGMYFENADGTGLIGNETAYNTWKLNDGILPRLLSTGALIGICIGSFFLLLLIIYVLGYFFLYRKGKLDEKKIKVIYKILPRGEYNLKEDKK